MLTGLVMGSFVINFIFAIRNFKEKTVMEEKVNKHGRSIVLTDLKEEM